MNTYRSRAARRAVLMILGLVVVAGACSSSPSPSAKASRATAVAATPTTVKKLNPYYDAGQTVTITASGFEPKQLIATVKVPIHFVNKTTRVQHVLFEHTRGADGQLISSGAIPAGQTWTYTPQTWESATYHSVDQPALRGQIQIQPPAEP